MLYSTSRGDFDGGMARALPGENPQVISATTNNIIIAVDARKYGPQDSGIGRYMHGLLCGLLGQMGEEVFLCLLEGRDSQPSLPYDGPRVRFIPIDAPYHSLRAFWRLPKILKDQEVTLFHSHNYHIPPLLPCPLVLTVHDLTPLQFPPSQAARLGKPLLWLLFKMATQKARVIIVPSQWTSEELQSRLKVSQDKIRVIPEGVNEQFRRRAQHDEINRVRRTYDLPEQFLLYVGRWRPHKNIPTMLRAFQRVAGHQTEGSLQLVVVGVRDPQGFGLFDNAINDTARPVRFTGFVDDKDLPAVYSASTALIAPSFAEGFGLTALEAMACGTPVVAANAGALPEVCGDAALLVDPYSVPDMANALSSIIADRALRERLAEKGKARTRLFTWEKTAHETMDAYREVLSNTNSI